MSERWPVVRLGDLAEVVTKGTTPTSVGHEFVDAGINFIKVESITPSGRFIRDKFAHITAACHADLGRSQLQAGDILFSIAGALGRTGFVTSDVLPANTNQALAIIRLKKGAGVYQEFVLKALETGIILEQIEKFKGGVAQQNLSLAQVRDFCIALPPLPEQQRIVALLDEAFAGLATAKANTERNLQNARALFDSHLEAVFRQRGEGWVEQALSELCDIKHGYAFSGEFFSAKGDYVLLTPGNFYESGGYRDRGDKQKYFTGEIPLDYVLREGDLLVAMTEQAAGLLGSSLLVPESDKFLHNQRLGLVTAKPGVPWSNEFFFHVFNTQHVRRDIHASASGVKVRHTSPTKIGEVIVSFPVSLQEQSRLVAEFVAVSAETQRLTCLYERKLAALDELKKSLLHQAFNGEL